MRTRSAQTVSLVLAGGLSFLNKTIDMNLDPAIIKGGGVRRGGELPFALVPHVIFIFLPLGVQLASSLFRPRRYA